MQRAIPSLNQGHLRTATRIGSLLTVTFEFLMVIGEHFGHILFARRHSQVFRLLRILRVCRIMIWPYLLT